MIDTLIEPLRQWSWEIDGWIVATGVLCAIASALLGNFLVLRRMSMLGDAVTHAILPGLAVAFFVSDSRSSPAMFIGAVIVGVLTALFTEWVRGAGRVDEGASMGVVFTSLFALGLIMVVQAADQVDLDPGCVLYGSIELTPLDRVSIGGYRFPRAAIMLAVVTLINLLFVVGFRKELKISSFDPGLATTMGISAKLMHYGLMVLVAVTAVASFESVGNILVVAMLVVPAASAFLLTDRLGRMIVISVVIATLSAILGHVAAITLPTLWGFQSTTTAGMMAVATGTFFVLAVALGPRHGVLVRLIRGRMLSMRILCDDVCAFLYRLEEQAGRHAASRGELREQLLTAAFPLRMALAWLSHRGQVSLTDQGYQLTANGVARARQLVRSHRLWEQYLVDRAGMSEARIHDKAEQWEHFTDQELRSRLDRETDRPAVDPHGRQIPDERNGMKG